MTISHILHYWIQTNKQTYRQAIFIYRCINCYDDNDMKRKISHLILTVIIDIND